MKMVLLDARIFAGGADLSGSGNKIELSDEAEFKTTTNWRSGGAREGQAGLAECQIQYGGQWEAGNASYPDDAAWAQRRTKEPWSVAPEGDSDLAPGNLMYLTRAITLQRSFWGGVGEVAEASAMAAGDRPLVRGLSAHASGVPRTATGTGTALELGAVTAGRYLYANLHVLSVSGTSTPTITVSVQSDDNSGFSSATTRGSFAAKTAVGGEQIRIAGPFTDTWWRLSWTISGSTPSFLFLASMGIE